MQSGRRPVPAPPRAAQRARDEAGGPRVQGDAAQRMNTGPHAASLAALRNVVAQRACADCEHVRRAMGGAEPAQRAAADRGGLPDGLRAGLESLSGRDLSGVTVHYNSPRPAQVNAHAFAQGSAIHLAPGQEQHLPHEGWHAVQQMQGRVRPTLDLGGTPVNDDAGLEREADAMGARAASVGGALQRAAADGHPPRARRQHARTATDGAAALQRAAKPGSVRVSTAPAPRQQHAAVLSGASGGQAPVQALLVKVKTQKPEAGERVISSVEFEGRAPTVVSGGQGDHTVAETLAEAALIRTCVGRTHAEAAVALWPELSHLHEQAVARVGARKARLGFDEVAGLLTEYERLANDPAAEGEDRNTALEAFLEGYLRLWNKYPGGAYARRAGATTGGGKERAAIGSVREIDRVTTATGAEDHHIPTLAQNAVELVDFVPARSLDEAVTHVGRAMEMIFSSVPEMEFYNQDVALATAEAYARKYALNPKEANALADGVLDRVSARPEYVDDDEYKDDGEDMG